MKVTPCSTYPQIVNAFTGKRILVIGDLILDVYLRGMSTRLCPEAPVPVVNVGERISRLGGAANTVCNLAALGANVNFCSVIGCDPTGDEALLLLERTGVDTRMVIRHAERKTISKSRVMSGPQLVTRIDEGTEAPVDVETSTALAMCIEESFTQCDAVVISDYDKGVINAQVIDKLMALKQKRPLLIAVDSKRLSFFRRLHPAYIKPNYNEALALLGLPAKSCNRIQQINAVAPLLFRKTNAPLITVTLDGEGSLMIENGKPTGTYAAPSIARPHVSGAGDTYLSAFVLSFLSSGNCGASAEIATAAASIAVDKECTASCSQTELKTRFNIHSKFLTSLSEVDEICRDYRATGKRIVFTNGCFDILHSGHVSYLRQARELGDVLIVGLNTDDSIRRIKGNDRPINSMEDRLQVLSGLSSVDHIVPFGTKEDDTPVPLIRAVRPEIFVKGGDYKRENLPEAATVESVGGKIVIIDHVPDHSTTRIINRINRITVPAKEATLDHDRLEGS